MLRRRSSTRIDARLARQRVHQALDRVDGLGRPAPRYGPVGVVLVSTPSICTSMVGMSYTLVDTHGPIRSWMIAPAGVQ
jgi:hypothetical protein